MNALEQKARAEAGIRWAEGVLGARAVSMRGQNRWRPHWFVDFEKPDGEILQILMRGYRNPGYMDEARSRRYLAKEAQIYRALEGTGVKAPRAYGYDPEAGWLLLERMPGDHELSKLKDRATQKQIFREYVDNLVRMHKLDYRDLDLPADIVPSNANATLDLTLGSDGQEVVTRPEPLFELCSWWFKTYRPAPPDRLSLCGADMGAEQFMFHEGHFRGIFDIEAACINDPLLDACSMRNRDMLWPVPDAPEYVRYWAEQMGRELDRTSVTYWTLICLFPILVPLYRFMEKPDPRFPADCLQLHASDTHHRRGSVEALAEFYGVPLSPPPPPPETHDRMSALGELIGEQIRAVYMPKVDEDTAYQLACTAALADSAALRQSAWPGMARQTLGEIAEILGYQPSDLDAGLAALQERVRKDPEGDLHRVLPVLHNMEVRREYLFAPIKKLADYALNSPLQRLWP